MVDCGHIGDAYRVTKELVISDNAVLSAFTPLF